jgi:four helix bundle protein
MKSKVEGQGSKVFRTRFRFENLDVWQSARRLNRSIYQVTRSFPHIEQFALASQLRRASVSISSNIAEGSGSNKDFAHFLEQAYASATEVASQLYLAFDEDYFDETIRKNLLGEIRVASAQTAALNRSVRVQSSKVAMRNGEPSALDLRPSTSPRHV